MEFAQNLKSAMNSKSITMYRLAKELGIHQTTIKNWLDGKGEPRVSEVEAIASVLGVDTYSLMTWDQATAGIEGSINAGIDAQKRVNSALERMTTEGMKKAADMAEIIAGNPKYRRQEAGEAASASGVSSDTAPAGELPERP